MKESHRGLVPNDPIFANLLETASKINHVVIHDPNAGVNADFSQLLTDTLHMQIKLKQHLPAYMFDDLRQLLVVQNPYILILSGKYGFMITALAILAIGGAFVPLATELLPEEIFFMLKASHAIGILADERHLGLAKECRQYAAAQGIDIAVLSINVHTPLAENFSEPQSLFEIDGNMILEPHRPALILFTSGTSGPPKGVVHTRRLLYDIHLSSSPDEVLLSHDGIHWGSSLVTFLASVLAGARTEIIPQDAEAIWKRLKEGGVTTLGCAPRIWTLMMIYFQDHLSSLPPEERKLYVNGAQRLRYALTRGSMPEPSVLRFWRDLGKRLHICYGITELGATVMRTIDDTDPALERCIGRPVPGITVKLSDGNHGELLIKKKVVFSHYLNDHGETALSFDEEGYYKTGDFARLVGEDYFIEGRGSTDFIRCKGLKVPVLAVEMRLLQLPFVSEGCILPVFDALNGHQVAALVRLRDHDESLWVETGQRNPSQKATLTTVRRCLEEELPAFMLPTALRTLLDGEAIPRTASLKVIRSKAVDQYFPVSENWQLPTTVEVLQGKDILNTLTRKAWDWGGL